MLPNEVAVGAVVSGFFNVSEKEAVILTAAVDAVVNRYRSRHSISEIARNMDCGLLKVLQFRQEVKSLTAKGFFQEKNAWEKVSSDYYEGGSGEEIDAVMCALESVSESDDCSNDVFKSEFIRKAPAGVMYLYRLCKDETMAYKDYYPNFDSVFQELMETFLDAFGLRRNDRYLSAEQALEYGICDEIIREDDKLRLKAS